MNKSDYNPKDVPQFQEDVCKKCCIRKGACIDDPEKDAHWFLMCPHYFNWKLKVPKSYISKYLEWEREHPEEAEANAKRKREAAKKYAAEKRAAKKAEKEKLKNMQNE